jgi:hypothetical protein
MNVINQIEMETIKNGGCSYSLSAGSFVPPGSPLYTISLHKELEEIYPIDEFDSTKLQMFIIKNGELLWMPQNVIGTWMNEGLVYVDITTLFDKGNTTPEQLQEMRGDQMAAWDMETNEVITF